MFALNKATGEKVWERRSPIRRWRNVTLAPLVIRDIAIVARPAASSASAAISTTTSPPAKTALAHLHHSGAGSPATNLKDGQDRWKAAACVGDRDP